MCGILYSDINSIKEKRFLNAINLMHHRGPDAEGLYCKNNIKMGQKRLKIIDLDDRSNQPFFSNDRRYVIIYNGEIYNYKEVAKQFDIKLKTTSDTELLIELFSIKGKDMLNVLNGMFAFVIYDTKNKEIFVARDRLGVKPLYIYQSNEGLIISSEIAPILFLTADEKVDEIGIRQYRKMRTFFNNRTMYSSIKFFPAGSYLQNNKITKYWDLTFNDQKSPSEEELKELVESAVKYRCISDVPVGSYLSGGLDSSIVARLSMKPHTWTIGFPSENEFEYGKIAAESFKSTHHEVLINHEEFLELAEEMIKKRKEPLSVPNEVLIYKMTKEVKKYNTVILSGEGADELFSGYDRIFSWSHINSFDLKEFSKLYSYGSNDDLEIVEDAIAPFLTYGSNEKIISAFFQIAHLHGLLRRLDNSTMICSVEARVPFVDYRLVERLAGVDHKYKMKNGVIKYPLKKVFKDIIPIEIIKRKKVGFPVPLDRILPPNLKGNNFMDKWFEYNLNILHIEG